MALTGGHGFTCAITCTCTSRRLHGFTSLMLLQPCSRSKSSFPEKKVARKPPPHVSRSRHRGRRRRRAHSALTICRPLAVELTSSSRMPPGSSSSLTATTSLRMYTTSVAQGVPYGCSALR